MKLLRTLSVIFILLSTTTILKPQNIDQEIAKLEQEYRNLSSLELKRDQGPCKVGQVKRKNRSGKEISVEGLVNEAECNQLKEKVSSIRNALTTLKGLKYLTDKKIPLGDMIFKK